MSSSEERSIDLRQRADDVIEKLRRHVEVLSGERLDPAAVVAVHDQLAAAASAYSAAVFDLTGWGDPFAAHPAGQDEEETESSEAASVFVEARYELTIMALHAVRDYLAARGLDPEENENADISVVSTLFQADGWDPSIYSDFGLRFLGSSWDVGHTSNPAESSEDSP